MNYKKFYWFVPVILSAYNFIATPIFDEDISLLVNLGDSISILLWSYVMLLLLVVMRSNSRARRLRR